MQSGKPLLVIGGGIAGLTAAVEASETGSDVIIVEREPFLGGRVFRMHKYFPKLCAPQCGMEINFQRIRSNPRIRVITHAEVESITGSKGNFEAKIKIGSKFINENCTSCGKCVDVCPVEIDDDFNSNMSKKKAVFQPHPMSYPTGYTIDTEACKGASCSKCVDVCEYDAIDLSDKGEETTIHVNSVLFATGWKPYDANKLTTLAFGKAQNVISNVMFERIASNNGPTDGKIVRPSDNKEVKNIAVVQCAGSRDENHLPYCSAVCCLASLKQTKYIREAYPDSKVTIFYIDIRTPGRYETFQQKVAADENVTLIKGKVARITEDASTKDVILHAEDVMNGEKIEFRADMAILATGMVPSLNGEGENLMATKDEHGFIDPASLPDGMSVAGVAERPMDVMSSVMSGTAIALKNLGGDNV